MGSIEFVPTVANIVVSGIASYYILVSTFHLECLVFKTKEDRTAFARLQRSFSRETSFRDLCRLVFSMII